MSFSINKTLIAGNVGEDPRIDYLPGSGLCKASFSLASNETYKRNGELIKDTQWHNVEFIGKVAEVIEKHVKKGTGLYVEGRIKYDSWTDRETGQKKYRTVIVGESFKFTTGKDE